MHMYHIVNEKKLKICGEAGQREWAVEGYGYNCPCSCFSWQTRQ